VSGLTTNQINCDADQTQPEIPRSPEHSAEPSHGDKTHTTAMQSGVVHSILGS